MSLPSLPWIVLLLASGAAAARLLPWPVRPRKPALVPLPSQWTVIARPVFNADERRVYRLLREALPHHVVLAKLPLMRFCQPVDPKDVRYWYDLLGSAHVTFAICSPNGRVLAAVDLTGDRPSSVRAAQIKQSVLMACRVRHLQAPPDRLPTIAELQLLVPQSPSMPRGPQAASAADPMHARPFEPTRDPGRSGVAASAATQRAERPALWKDSTVFQDSFFSMEARGDLSRAAVPAPGEVAGIVVDERRPPAAPRR